MNVNWDSIKTVAAHIITAAGAIATAFGLADAGTVAGVGDALQTVIGGLATIVGLVLGVINDKATSAKAAGK